MATRDSFRAKPIGDYRTKIPTKQLGIRLTTEERAIIELAAALSSTNYADFMRRTALAKAREVLASHNIEGV